MRVLREARLGNRDTAALAALFGWTGAGVTVTILSARQVLESLATLAVLAVVEIALLVYREPLSRLLVVSYRMVQPSATEEDAAVMLGRAAKLGLAAIAFMAVVTVAAYFVGRALPAR